METAIRPQKEEVISTNQTTSGIFVIVISNQKIQWRNVGERLVDVEEEGGGGVERWNPIILDYYFKADTCEVVSI